MKSERLVVSQHGCRWDNAGLMDRRSPATSVGEISAAWWPSTGVAKAQRRSRVGSEVSLPEAIAYLKIG